MAPQQDGFTSYEQEPAMSFRRLANFNNSRYTFAPNTHYSRVLSQQGRVVIDADWNASLFEPPIDPALIVIGS
jgi:hypothetical protein